MKGFLKFILMIFVVGLVSVAGVYTCMRLCPDFNITSGSCG